jgi:antibiotic biosynthesis monooxygenase (ABM) superfamily enzyme
VNGIMRAAARWPGFLGGGVLRPGKAGQDWHVVYRFADASSLERWEESPLRAEWLAAAGDFARETGVARISGLETWFELPGRTAPAPPRWKMWLVTLVAVFPLALPFNVLVVPHLGGLPVMLRTLALSMSLTVLMTWLVMPRLTRMLAGWLYPSG